MTYLISVFSVYTKLETLSFDAVINDYSVSLVLKENKEIAIKTERIKQLEAYSIHYNYYYEFYGEYLLDNHSVLPFRMIFSLFM